MITAVKVDAPSPARVVVGRLERVRRGKRTAFEATTPKPVGEPTHARAALTLALAHTIQRAIDAGEIRDQAGAARQLGTTRARVTQLLDLTLLAPRVQEEVFEMIDVGRERVAGRALRVLLRYDSWAQQEAVWAAPRRDD